MDDKGHNDVRATIQAAIQDQELSATCIKERCGVSYSLAWNLVNDKTERLSLENMDKLFDGLGLKLT